MHVSLKVIEGKQSGTLIPLNRNKFLIGREEDCQLRPNSDLVSRHHCVFTTDDFTVRIRDLGSTNGTYVNNQRISGQVVLKHGDQIRIGKLAFEIQILRDAPVAATRTPDPIAIDYSLGTPSASETMTDFVIPEHLRDQAPSEVQTQMFGGETTITGATPGVPNPQMRAAISPTPAVAGAGASAGTSDAAGGTSAAEIIRDYMQRRPQ
jgi:predicted component of type VI protein secretion system